MSHALSQVQTIEVTRAVRASEVDGLKIAENDVIGLLNDRIVEAGQSPETVVKAVLQHIDAAKVGTVTIYAGADAREADRDALVTSVAHQFPKASVELQAGEQALYPYIVAVE
jgi:dihydroxyacetone kinase-like predicted kinase